MKKFDIKIESNVRLLPREVPSGMGEEIEWRRLESFANQTFREYAKSMEKYIEGQVEKMEFLYRASENCPKPCCYYHGCCSEENPNYCPSCGKKL